VNEQPYGDGWLVAIEPTEPDQLETLLDRGGYEEHVAGS
jgi:glycine cleavage system H protein